MEDDSNRYETEEKADTEQDATPETEKQGLIGFVRNNRALVVHWVLFVGVLGVMVAVAEWAADWVNVHFAKGTAHAMAPREPGHARQRHRPLA